MIRYTVPYINEAARKNASECISDGHIGEGFRWKDESRQFLSRITKVSPDNILLTNSATSGLEIVAKYLNLQKGDEIICPDYTFVTTVLPFINNQATPVFCDIETTNGMAPFDNIKRAVTQNTKAILLLHYAGVAHPELEELRIFCRDNNIVLVEDAAQCIGSYDHLGRHLGTVGDFGVISFHDTKNVSCGYGGCLFVNRPDAVNRCWEIMQKGTNRRGFLSGSEKFYSLVERGSAYEMSALSASILAGNLEDLDYINTHRIELSKMYQHYLAPFQSQGHFLPNIFGDNCFGNGHLYFGVLSKPGLRDNLVQRSKLDGIELVSHYRSLSRSRLIQSLYPDSGERTDNSACFADSIVRFPLHLSLNEADVENITNSLTAYLAETGVR